MKKKSIVLSAIILGVCFFAATFLMTGCSKNVEIEGHLSDIRKCLYVAESDEYFVTAVSGQRENPYAYDGVSNSNVDFCIVSIYPQKQTLDQQTLEVEFCVGDVSHEVTLEKSPYENAYMADLGAEIASAQIVKLTCDELELSCDLECVSQNWEIDYNAALNIAKTEFEDQLNEHSASGTLEGECYLKIIFDKSRDIKTYFWYFTFVDSNKQSFSCVIDVMSGKILAKV